MTAAQPLRGTRVVLYRVRPGDAEEILVATLWLAGVLGLEEQRRGDDAVELAASFPLAGDLPSSAALAASGAVVLGEAFQLEEDWLARHRELARPRAIGRFLVDPREPEESAATPAQAAAQGRIALRVPARTAFGTGSHESTRLALALLEEVPLGGRRVLDVGCGSGILAFAAARLGAAAVVAFDIDPEASLLAAQHAALNDVAPALFAGTLDALALPAAARGFDVALVNILPEVIAAELPKLVPLLAPGAAVVLAGILVAQGEELLAALADLPLRLVAERVEGEWVGYRLEAAPAAPTPRATGAP